MTPAPSSSITTNALLFGGDWACAHGDVETLAHLTRLLADRFDDPLQVELLELSRLCRQDQELAARRWSELRRRVSGS